MPASFSIELFARAVEAVRAEAQVNTAVLVGYEVGALVIRTYALKYPTRVAGLVILNGHIPFTTGRPGPPANLLTDAPARREDTMRYVLDQTSPQLQERIRKMMLAPPDTTVTGTRRALWGALLDPSQTEQVTVPVLAVYSGLSLLNMEESYAKRFFPMAEYYEMPKTGYFVMMEASAAVNRLIAGFLAGIAF